MPLLNNAGALKSGSDTSSFLKIQRLIYNISKRPLKEGYYLRNTVKPLRINSLDFIKNDNIFIC